MHPEHKRSYLFTTWEGGGNVPPVLGLAQRLVARGHRVRILAEPCLEAAVLAIRAEFIPFKKHFTRTDRTQDLIQDWNTGPLNLATFNNVIVGPAMDVAADTLAAVKKAPTDVVVADLMMIGSLIAAEALRVPRVALFHMPEYLPGPNRPPGGFGLNPKAGVLGRLRDRTLSWMFNRLTGKFLPQINAVRAHYGLGSLHRFTDLYHKADLRLIQTCEVFDLPISPAPSNVRYVGPVLDDPDWSGKEWLRLPHEGANPLVVISMSSTFQNQRQKLENAIAAVGSLPMNGLVTLGPSMAKELFQAPDNVSIIPACPHSKVFPKASVVVTHAGHGTVMRALASGVPLVCLPMGRDQDDNAARVAFHGAGVKLSARAKPQHIAEAIELVHEDRSFAQNALRLQRSILADAKGDCAVEELEAVAQLRSVFKSIA